jgi:transposase
MYRIMLTEDQRAQLNRRAHEPGIAPSTRDRLEMVRLSDAGWRIPQIARHLGPHEQTVRFWIKAFQNGGFDALVNQPRGGDTSALTPAMIAAVREEIQQGERTWNAGQLAEWIADKFGVRLSPGRIRFHLKKARLTYKRTNRTLRHKQKAAEVAAKRAELDLLEKGAKRAS